MEKEKETQLTLFTNLNNNKYTYKSTDLIESSYELSLTEQRIISMGCKMIQPIYIEKNIKPNDLKTVLGAMKFSNLRISVNDYVKEYNIKAKNIYATIKKSASDLYKRNVQYYDEKGNLTEKRWVTEITYDDGEGCIRFTFNPNMIQDLLVFKGKYVALFFDMSQNVRSKYAFRLYEILKGRAYLGTYQVSLADLKFMLAIQEGNYENYADFNRKVIKPNIDAINNFSDIQVNYEPIRSGRSVSSIEFNIRKSENSKMLFSGDSKFNQKIPNSYKEISKALEKHNVVLKSEESEILFNSAIEVITLKKKDIDATGYILEKIKILDKYIQTNKVENVFGFLKKAVKLDYQLSSVDRAKLKFDNFEGRNYTDEQMYDIEKKLLGWED